MTCRLAAILGIVGLLVGPRLARGGDPVWAGRRPTILTLVVNQVPYGESLVLLIDGDALVAGTDLQRAGVAIGGAHTETVRDRSFVSLRSLGIRFLANEPAMKINLTVSPELLGTTRIDLGRGGAPAGVTYQDQTSAYVNYAVHAARDVERDRATAPRVDGFGEAGLRLGGALAQSTVTVSDDRWPVRGASHVTWDDRDDLRRFIVGDQLVLGGGLGGSAFVGGLHLARAFDLDPYLATTPAVDLRGAVMVPSTADVYVDGALVRRIELSPGTYDLSNLPAAVGAGVTRVVLRDPLGRTQELRSSFYLPAGLLRPGLSDYALSVGFRRERLSTDSFTYGGPVAVGRYRRGVAGRLTAGVRGEASLRLASGGAAVSTGSRLGQLELGFGASVDRGRTGVAGSLAWAFVGRRGGSSLVVRALSARYATLGIDRDADRALVESRLDGSRAIGRHLGVSGQVSGAVRRDGGWSTSASATGSFATARGYTLSATVGSREDDRVGRTLHALASLSIGVGERTRGGISHEQDGARRRERVDLHRTIAQGSGVGYRLSGQLGDRDLAAGEIEARTRFGRYQLGYQQRESGGRAELTASGGVAVVGGRVFATRSIERSFVLVRVPGAAGVRVYLDNKEVGRTDRAGDLLVTDALPHYGNRIAIEAADLPDDRPPTRTSVLLAPPERGGVVVAFPAPRLRVVRGVVVVERAGERIAPAYGELVVGALPDFDDPESQLWTSPLGTDGEFEINGLPAGGHPTVIVWSGGHCELVLDIPESDAGIANVGVQVCQVPKVEVRR